MSKLGQFFDFTSGQIKFLLAMCVTALALGLYLMIRTYATPPPEAVSLPVFMADSDNSITGLFKIDPNTSPVDSLELMPGIGPVLADRIVTYRQHSHFDQAIDITEVKGIGPKLFEKIRPYIKVKQP